MQSKVRVYELARELGITNKEVIDLCGVLGIGVKSHSSSIVDAQADRLRRKAERDGIKKDPIVVKEEPKPKAKPAKKAATNKPVTKKTAAKKAAAKKTDTKEKPVVNAKSNEDEQGSSPSTPTPLKSASGKVVSSAGKDDSAIPAPPPRVHAVEPAISSKPVAPVAKQQPAPVVRKPEVQVKPVEAKAAEAKVAEVKAPEIKAPAAKAPEGEAPEGEAPKGGAPKTKAAPKPADGPVARKMPVRPKKPIPPPPKSTGKPIPPPPANRGRGGDSSGSSAPGRSRPQGRPSTGSGSPGGFSNGPMPGGGMPMGGPPTGGRPSGKGGPNRGRPRRKSRRKKSETELLPMDLPTYSAEDAPVPDGTVVIERSSTPQDLGPKLNRTAADVVRFLLTNGDMVTATQSLSDEMINLFAGDVGAEIRLVDPGEEQEVELQKMLQVVESDLISNDSGSVRPPVVTVMGHVDHGKTKLLDKLRSANVVDGEAGGITQHIGAYQIERDGKKITFLDTPGHEAFTAMRARGANATDIVILVVAADDGVMPQTLEALDHARAAEVPILVAINKIDREGSDPQRVMTQLAERNLVPEAWGGDTIMCEVSAMTGDGIDDLVDNLLLIAEVEDLKADPEAKTIGIVLESHLDIGRGSVATVLVEQGTLRVGDPLVTGAAWGRVRALVTDRGDNVDEAIPSMPVQVLGLNDVASAGDKFVIAPSEKVASKVASTRAHWQRVASLGRDASSAGGSGAKLEDIFAQIQAGEVATLNLVVKADVNGSLEAVCDSLKKLEKNEVKLSFVLRGVGGITRNDVQLAAASNATIIGFNVRPDREARNLAAQEQVEIRNYEIIYKLIEDIESAMLGLLAPEFEEVVTGEAQVREIFRVPKIGSIAGCMVSNGTITRGSKVRFLREGKIIWKGDIQSLKRFKEDAKEVSSGFECGIGLSDFQDLKEGDIIETFTEKEIERTLSDAN